MTTSDDTTSGAPNASGRWVVPALNLSVRGTLAFAGIVLALELVTGAAGYGLLTLATSVTWLPVMVVAGLLGSLLLLVTCLALVATAFWAPLALGLAWGAARD